MHLLIGLLQLSMFSIMQPYDGKQYVTTCFTQVFHKTLSREISRHGQSICSIVADSYHRLYELLVNHTGICEFTRNTPDTINCNSKQDIGVTKH